MVDELLADAEFKKFNKRKYVEIIQAPEKIAIELQLYQFKKKIAIRYFVYYFFLLSCNFRLNNLFISWRISYTILWKGQTIGISPWSIMLDILQTIFLWFARKKPRASPDDSNLPRKRRKNLPPLLSPLNFCPSDQILATCFFFSYHLEFLSEQDVKGTRYVEKGRDIQRKWFERAQ